MRKRLILLFTFLIIINVALVAQTPEWQWAEQAGGIDSDLGYRLAIDSAGNSYVTGSFEGTATFGSTSLTSSGGTDIFVAKMDANGNWLYAEQAGGSFYDVGISIALDSADNSYVTGYFMGTATFGSISLTGGMNPDIFVAKIDADGNWQWAEQAGGSFNDNANGIALDSAGNSYVIGIFEGTATFGSNSLTSSGEEDIFVAKMDADGNWQWAEQAGGSNSDYGYGIAFDSADNSYVTGYFMGTATFGSTSLTSSGEEDIFVAKIDADGNWLYAEKAGGIDSDRGNSLALDSAGNRYITGSFEGIATFGSTSLTSSGERDIFVAKMDADGNWLYAEKAGGTYDDLGFSLALDSTGSSYATGWFTGTATFGSTSLTSSGSTDIFVAKMDANGNWLYAVQAGGTSHDWGYSLVLDSAGNSYVTGCFMGTATFGSASLESSGDFDIFIAKLGNNTSVEIELIPIKMELSNYPNPFNPTTTLMFSIQLDSNIELSIYNIKGQKIKTLVKNEFEKGFHSVIWNGDDKAGKDVSSGIYYYQLKINGRTEAVKKCLLLK